MPDMNFDAGLKALSDRYRNLGERVAKVVNEGVEKIGEAAALKAAALTPRSLFDPVYPNRSGDGGHIADFWRAKTRKRGQGVAVTVHNVHPRAHETPRGQWTVLEMLEYGVEPHTNKIVPVAAPALVFWVRGSKPGVVVTQEVQHPGNRPYAMLAITRSQADITMKHLLDTVRTAIRIVNRGGA